MSAFGILMSSIGAILIIYGSALIAKRKRLHANQQKNADLAGIQVASKLQISLMGFAYIAFGVLIIAGVVSRDGVIVDAERFLEGVGGSIYGARIGWLVLILGGIVFVGCLTVVIWNLRYRKRWVNGESDSVAIRSYLSFVFGLILAVFGGIVAGVGIVLLSYGAAG